MTTDDSSEESVTTDDSSEENDGNSELAIILPTTLTPVVLLMIVMTVYFIVKIQNWQAKDKNRKEHWRRKTPTQYYDEPYLDKDRPRGRLDNRRFHNRPSNVYVNPRKAATGRYPSRTGNGYDNYSYRPGVDPYDVLESAGVQSNFKKYSPPPGYDYANYKLPYSYGSKVHTDPYSYPYRY